MAALHTSKEKTQGQPEFAICAIVGQVNGVIGSSMVMPAFTNRNNRL